jgi:hypothetical protein
MPGNQLVLYQAPTGRGSSTCVVAELRGWFHCGSNTRRLRRHIETSASSRCLPISCAYLVMHRRGQVRGLAFNQGVPGSSPGRLTKLFKGLGVTTCEFMSTLVPDSGSKIDFRAQLRLVQDLHPAPSLARNPLRVEAQRRRGGGMTELGAHVVMGAPAAKRKLEKP